MEYTVLIGRSENGYAACVEGLQGVCMAAAETREETETLIREAVELHLQEARSDAMRNKHTAMHWEAPEAMPTLRFVDVDAPKPLTA